jgi:uncharacterized membrane protein (UPF0127 family)
LVCASAAFVISVTGAVACANPGHHASSSSPTTATSVAGTTTTALQRIGIEGFEPVAFGITPTDGNAKTFCGLLADTAERQATGLMGQHDLGGYDGMVFAFSGDVTASFYMYQVPVPLSVAWFAADGSFVSASDMAPCTVAMADCPLYLAAGPYRYAVEVLKGGLSSLGVGVGSSLHVGGACA